MIRKIIAAQHAVACQLLTQASQSAEIGSFNVQWA